MICDDMVGGSANQILSLYTLGDSREVCFSKVWSMKLLAGRIAVTIALNCPHCSSSSSSSSHKKQQTAVYIAC